MNSEIFITQIAIYRSKPNVFKKEMENWANKYGTSKSRSWFEGNLWYLQQYNDVVGWWKIYALSDLHNPNVQRFMEIYSMWGYFDDMAFSFLNKGEKFGFTGGGDCHEGRCGFSVEDADGQGVTPHTFARDISYRCGLTASVMPNLTRKDLIKSLRDRKIYPTTGARILLDFKISGLSMGEEGTLNDAPELTAEIHACEQIELVEVIKNGEVIHSVKDVPEDYTLSWQDNSGESGWYVIRVTQKVDGQKAWSSPIWIKRS